VLGASGSLGGALVLLLFVLVVEGVSIYAIIEAAKRPRSDWDRAGESKSGWLIGLVISAFVLGLGLIVAIVFLTRIRRRLDAGGVNSPPLDRRGLLR